MNSDAWTQALTVDGDMVGIAVSQPSRFDWKPQPDITAHELALCLPILIRDWADGVAALPPEARRHFEEI